MKVVRAGRVRWHYCGDESPFARSDLDVQPMDITGGPNVFAVPELIAIDDDGHG